MNATRLRLTSDGTPQGTRITTEDGTLIKGVQMVAWQLTLQGMARMQVEFAGVALDVIGLEEGDGSMAIDPTAIVELAVPQDPPEGPGFPERLTVDQEGTTTQLFKCPDCGAMYDDEDEICSGDDITGEHPPMKLVRGPVFVEEG